jgi:phosphohistidine swiveling domain-containing protein
VEQKEELEILSKMTKWQTFAEENGDIFPIYFLYQAVNEGIEPIVGIKVDNWMLCGKNHEWEFVIDPENWKEVGQTAYNRLKKDKNFIDKVRKKIVTGCECMIEFSEEVSTSDLSGLSNNEIFKIFKEYGQRNKSMYSWGMILSFIEFGIPLLSTEVRNIVQNKLRKRSKEDLLADYFITLTTSDEETIINEEEKEFLNIAKIIQNNFQAKELFKKSVQDIKNGILNLKELDKKINDHTTKYRFTGYGYTGPEWKKEHYLELFSDFIKNNEDAEKKLLEIEKKKKELIIKKKQILKELNFSDDELHIIKAASEFGFLKVYRKDLLYKSYYHMHNWLEEVSKRFKLAISQLRHMTPEEVESMLINNVIPDKKMLDERIKFYTYTLQNQKFTMLQGKEAKEFYEKTVEKVNVKNVSELKGECACQGKAIGLIRLVRIVEDIKKMSKGDILISPATNPNLVPAMKIAGAIVTDEGGITCHAAIVSRELGIPCLTGTKIVTKAFKDGDKVEVDATNGTIKRI